MLGKFSLDATYVYAVIALLVIAFMATTLLDSQVTGLATGTTGTDGSTTSGSIQHSDAEPFCESRCGTPCWLVESGKEPGTFESSKGIIGFMACDGFCYEIEQSIGQMLCCKNSDCPSYAPVCSSGKCAVRQ
ncbi:MAG: hypothetical protein HYW25_04240 [Candidatus Aenigmarchaeota archaeon]|nr:hypothetical protein [Candidatus Aenigmarchaeota archaeon]